MKAIRAGVGRSGNETTVWGKFVLLDKLPLIIVPTAFSAGINPDQLEAQRKGNVI